MSKQGENTYLTGDCLVLWNGLSEPEKMPAKDGKQDGLRYSLSVAFPPNMPEYGELYHANEAQLMAEWGTEDKRPSTLNKGIIPIPAKAADAGYVEELQGWFKINPVTFNNMPDVFDAAGALVPVANLRALLYPGCKVRVLVTPRTYNDEKNPQAKKGTGFWLVGVQIIDATAPRLSVAAGVSTDQARAMFGVVAGAPALPSVAAPMPGTSGNVSPPTAPPAPPAPPAPGTGAASAPNMLTGMDYAEAIKAGWTDALLIQHGHMAAPQLAPPPPPAAVQAPPPPPTVVTPATGVLAPPPPPAAVQAPPPPPAGPQMTAKAGTMTYQDFIGKGWTDAALRSEGYMV